MKVAALSSGALAAASAVQAFSTPPNGLTYEQRAELRAAAVEQVARAMVETEVAMGKRTSPSGTYAPSNISCPQVNSTGATYVGLIRNASDFSLSPQESTYIRNHRAARKADWNTWLKQAQVGLDDVVPGGFDNYTSDGSRVPRIGIASSGGGYRAMLNGAGVFAAFDDRNGTAVSIGTGGLFQLADYLAGLSGGSWLTGSVAMNDYPTTQALHDQVWNLESNLVLPSDGKLKFYDHLLDEVNEKKDFVGNGHWTGITDYWGRALSHHLLNESRYPDHGINATWSDVKRVSNFANSLFPFPIIVADERPPGYSPKVSINGSAPIWEFTPYEYGTWDNGLAAFIDVDLIGTQLNNGQPDNNTCVSGWSNAGWVMGTSSTLFNGAFVEIAGDNGIVKSVLKEILKSIGNAENDVSIAPNAFQGFNVQVSDIASVNNITHVDGGEDGQNVPLWPLIHPARELDFIIAEDASADIGNDISWPNGTSLWTTAQRFQQNSISSGFSQYAFPYIPSMETFVNRGLNTRPTFFGCPGSKISNENSSLNNQPSPIIAYLPNYPYLGWGNTSTMKLSYENDESQTVMDNAFQVATMGNFTNGAMSWPTCLACGMLTRSFQRSDTPIPQKCQTCLDLYCWDGVENNTEVSTLYSPAVGKPDFITSNGQDQSEPAVTAANGAIGLVPSCVSSVVVIMSVVMAYL